MASVSKDGKGWRVCFTDPDGKRKTLRLGAVDKKTAESIRCHVEALLAAKTAGLSVRQETAAWLAAIGETLRDRLARAGLVEAKARLTVADWFAQWRERKRAEGQAPCTLAKLGFDTRAFVALFGDRALAAITAADGERLVEHLRGRGLRPATIHKQLQRTRQAFGDAVKRGLLEKNPLQYVRVSAGDPSDRRAYVSTADVAKCIEAAPNAHWRLLIALARFGGLRIPSEAFSLRWEHVDWERGRLTIESPKGKAGGKPYRVAPLFPALRPYLEEAFELAETGDVFVFPEAWRKRAQGPHGWINANMRTVFEKIVRRAGLTPWPRLWHNLRASCESDLAANFPLATVTKWLGNTPSVALRHYVDPTDSAFNQALNWNPTGDAVAQNPALQIAERRAILRKSPDLPSSQFVLLQHVATPCNDLTPQKVHLTGLEPVTFGSVDRCSIQLS